MDVILHRTHPEMNPEISWLWILMVANIGVAVVTAIRITERVRKAVRKAELGNVLTEREKSSTQQWYKLEPERVLEAGSRGHARQLHQRRRRIHMVEACRQPAVRMINMVKAGDTTSRQSAWFLEMEEEEAEDTTSRQPGGLITMADGRAYRRSNMSINPTRSCSVPRRLVFRN